MAVTRWDDEEHYEAYSANEYRKIFEKQDEERRRYQQQLLEEENAKRMKADWDDDVQAAKKTASPVTTAVEREFRSEIKKDIIGKEMYNEHLALKVASDIIIGTALIVSSCATEALHNKVIAETQDYSNALYEKETERIREQDRQTFSQYKEELDAARKDVRLAEKEYYTEYSQTKKEATQAINDENSRYEKETRLLEKEERCADRDYSKSIEAADDRIKNATDNYDKVVRDSIAKCESAVKVANDTYAREEQRIRKEFSSDEAKVELQKAVTQRDEAIKRANEESHAECISAREVHTRELTSAQQHKDQIVQAHENEIKDIYEKKNKAETNHTNIIQKQNDAISEATEKYKESTRSSTEVKELRTNADEKAKAFKENAIRVDDSAKYNNSMRERAGVVSSNSYGSKAAAEFVTDVNKKHVSLGQDIVLRLGSNEERDVLKRVHDDAVAKYKAEKNGDVYVPLASKEDYKQANTIVQKYAGDISSEKSIAATVDQLQKTKGIIVKEIAENETILVDVKDKLSNLNLQIDGTKDRLQKTQEKIKNAQASLEEFKKNGNVKAAKHIEKQIKEQNQEVLKLKKELTDLKAAKNKAKGDINDLQKNIKEGQKIVNGLDTHTALLQKGGKVIANTQAAHKKSEYDLATRTRMALDPTFRKQMKKKEKEETENAGQSKKAIDKQNKGVKMIFNSVNRISMELSKKRHQGNLIHQEMANNARAMKNAGRKYQMALNVGQTALKIFSKGSGHFLKGSGNCIRYIGGKTRLGQKLGVKLGDKFNKLANSDFGKKMKNVGIVAGVGGKTITGRMLKAPIKFLNAPMELMNLNKTISKKVATKSIRFTRKAVGKVGGKTMRFAKSKLNPVKNRVFEKLGKIPGFNKVAGRLNLMRKRLGSINQRFKDLKEELKKKAKELLKKAFMKLIAPILSAIITVLSFLLTAIGYAIAFLFMIMIVFVIVSAIISFFTSIIATITSFLKKQETDEKAKVCNEPYFIMNQAVNYRNSELEIFDLFYQASNNNVEISVNNSPIYYALNDGTWKARTTGSKEIKSVNQPTLNLFNNLESNINRAEDKKNFTVSSNIDKVCESNVTKYNSVQLSYYTSDAIETDSKGNYKTETHGEYEQVKKKSNAIASEYEISNAKDAFAMVDALYTIKKDTMQKMEVAAYLGVGDYELGNVNSGEHINSLFWASHRFSYNSGNCADDIWYHVTEQRSTDYYVLNLNKRYMSNGSGKYTIGYTNTNQRTCTNQEKVEYQYTEIKTELVPYTVEIYEEVTTPVWGWQLVELENGRHTYKYVIVDTITETVLVGTETEYREETTEIQHTGTFYVCKGHIDLDVNMFVSLAENGSLYDDAMEVEGLENDETVGGLITIDKKNAVVGWLPNTRLAFHPYEDWEEGSNFRELANIKLKNETDYYADEDENFDKVSTTITHLKQGTFQSITKASDNQLLFGLMFNGQKYYVTSFMSGEQKNLKAYKLNSTSLDNGGHLSFPIGKYTHIPNVVYPSQQ